MKKLLLLLLVSLCIGHQVWGQNNEVDSLQKLLKRNIPDTLRVDVMNDLAFALTRNNPRQSEAILRQAIHIAQNGNYQRGLAASYRILAYSYRLQANYSEAAQNYLNALQIAEKLYNKREMARACHGLGLVYSSQKNFDLAHQYLQRSLAYRLELDFEPEMLMNAIGSLYNDQEDFKQAKEYLLKGIEIAQKNNRKSNLAYLYNSLGILYSRQKNYKEALKYLKLALDIHIEEEQVDQIVSSYQELGIVYKKTKDYFHAHEYFKKAIHLAQKNHLKDEVKECSNLFAILLYETGEYKEAYEALLLAKTISDSIYSESSAQKIADLQHEYGNFQKQLEIEILQKDKEIKEEAIERHKQQLFALALFIFLFFCFVIIYFYQRRKAHKALKIKNEEITKHIDQLVLLNTEILQHKEELEANKEIMEHNQRITQSLYAAVTQSINYAQRIQRAILPTEKEMHVFMPASFAFVFSKDILSGDFYWFLRVEKERKMFVAVADCTGHGVPASLMTIIGVNLLQQIIGEHKIYNPAQILHELDFKVRSMLRKHSSAGELNDGMDIALCVIHLDKNIMEYGAAKRPLWHLRHGILCETKGNIFPIGSEQFQEKNFTSHQIELFKGDRFYLFSDGFCDQFDAENKKRYGTKNFKNFITSIQEHPITAQKKLIVEEYKRWKGFTKQTDDIVVLGFEIE